MGQQKKIIIADDDPGIVNEIEMMLDYEGYEVETTADGHTFDCIKRSSPELVLLEIWIRNAALPGWDDRRSTLGSDSRLRAGLRLG